MGGFGETVVRIRLDEDGRDPFGDPLGEEDGRVDIEGCAVAPAQSGEAVGGGRLAVSSGLTVYAPAGTDVVPSDRFEVRGVLYEVDGEPGDWRSPYDQTARGVEIPLKRVQEGAA